MKKLLSIFTILILLTSCVAPYASSGPGFLVTSTIEGQSATDNIKLERTGESCQVSVLGLFAVGDSSIEAAKINGMITQVGTVDRSYFGLLGLFGKTCLIVKGN